MTTVRVTLYGCDDAATRRFDVTADELALLQRLQEAFGTNERMQHCEPGLEVAVIG